MRPYTARTTRFHISGRRRGDCQCVQPWRQAGDPVQLVLCLQQVCGGGVLGLSWRGAGRRERERHRHLPLSGCDRVPRAVHGQGQQAARSARLSNVWGGDDDRGGVCSHHPQVGLWSQTRGPDGVRRSGPAAQDDRARSARQTHRPVVHGTRDQARLSGKRLRETQGKQVTSLSTPGEPERHPARSPHSVFRWWRKPFLACKMPLCSFCAAAAARASGSRSVPHWSTASQDEFGRIMRSMIGAARPMPSRRSS